MHARFALVRLRSESERALYSPASLRNTFEPARTSLRHRETNRRSTARAHKIMPTACYLSDLPLSDFSYTLSASSQQDSLNLDR